MSQSSDDSQHLLIESDQETDTIVSYPLSQATLAHILSFRSAEAKAQALPCQDYGRVMSNREGSCICFCVCDGVGSSYKGNFAAQHLAIHLVDWLYTLKAIPRRFSSRLLKSLRPQLDRWAHNAHAELMYIEIPPELPALVQEVLEELRKAYGSEAVFLCGRIDDGRYALSNTHTRRIRAYFIWMGNVTARLFITSDNCIDLGDKGNDTNRWSTAHGHQGILKTKTFDLNTIDRLIVYTDGLDSIEGELDKLDTDGLQMRIQELLALPINDDMTILDLKWLHNTTEKVERT